MLRTGFLFILVGGIGICLGIFIPPLRSYSLPVLYGDRVSKKISFDASAEYAVAMSWDTVTVPMPPSNNPEQAVVDVTINSEKSFQGEHFTISPQFLPMQDGTAMASSSNYLIEVTHDDHYMVIVSGHSKYARLNQYHPRIDFSPNFTEIQKRMWINSICLTLGIFCSFLGCVLVVVRSGVSLKTKRNTSK